MSETGIFELPTGALAIITITLENSERKITEVVTPPRLSKRDEEALSKLKQEILSGKQQL